MKYLFYIIVIQKPVKQFTTCCSRSQNGQQQPNKSILLKLVNMLITLPFQINAEVTKENA